jgi:hypothetical protein
MIRNTAGTILLAATVTAAALTQATYVRAAGKYDGTWSVVVYTRSGPCDAAYRFSGQIVNVSSGSAFAVASGHLSGARGAGTWYGQASGGRCAGSWVAQRS